MPHSYDVVVHRDGTLQHAFPFFLVLIYEWREGSGAAGGRGGATVVGGEGKSELPTLAEGNTTTAGVVVAAADHVLPVVNFAVRCVSCSRTCELVACVLAW